MKSLSLHLLLSVALAAMPVNIAMARKSLLTVITTGASIKQATANARTLLRIECNFLRGQLIGTLQVIETQGFSIKAQQLCDGATLSAVAEIPR